MVLNFGNISEATRRGVRVRLLFPFPQADWLATMIAATDSDRTEYARRITTNAARARTLGPAVDVRWYGAPVTTWFTILDDNLVAYKAINFAAREKPSITAEPGALAYHQRLFDGLWTSAEQSVAATPSGSPHLGHNKSPNAKSVFFSYADEDGQHFDTLRNHLISPLRHRLVESWHRGLIPAGDAYRSEITRHIERARVILLLMSANWLTSKICQDEFQQALTLSDSGRARMVPILLRPCRFEDSPRLAELAHLRWLADGQGRIDARCSHSKPLGGKDVPRR